MIKLSAFSDEAGSALSAQISALLKNGVYYTEIRNVGGVGVLDFTVEQAKEYRKAFADNGIKIWSVGSPIGKVDINTDFTEYSKKLRHACELCNAFETDKMRIFSFFKAYDQRDKVIENLSEMVKIAKEYSVTLYHENEKEIYGDVADRVKDILDNVNGLKSIYDPANYIQCGERAEDTLAALHGRTDYFHIKDVVSETGEIVPAGYGDGMIDKLIADITDDKVLSIEPHLALFAGYAAIDGSEMKNKFKFATQEEAFSAAVTATRELILKAGYKEENGAFVK